jgi:hypothetical protein
VKPPRYFSDEPELSPFLKALNDVRARATREGWCYQHVQAIIVSIDQYAEAATGNREYFLNKPHSAGGSQTRVM